MPDPKTALREQLEKLKQAREAIVKAGKWVTEEKAERSRKAPAPEGQPGSESV